MTALRYGRNYTAVGLLAKICRRKEKASFQPFAGFAETGLRDMCILALSLEPARDMLHPTTEGPAQGQIH